MKRTIGLIIMMLAVSLSLCTFAAADVKIDEESFPDNIFREHIQSEYDEDEDGYLSEDEIESIPEDVILGDYVFTLKKMYYGEDNLQCEWEISDYIGRFLPRSLEEIHIPEEIYGFPVQQPTALRDHVFGDIADMTVHIKKMCGIFRYCPVSDTECYVIGILEQDREDIWYDKDDSTLFIPEKLDQYTVVGIADSFVVSSGGYLDQDVAKVYILPDTIRHIGNNAFGYTYGMIRLNEGLKSIADFAFTMNRHGVLILPTSIEQIGKNPFHDDFDGGNNSPLYLVDSQGQPWKSDNGKYQVLDGSLYDITEMRLITYLDQMEYVDGQYRSVKEYHVPEGTRVIGEDAFIGTRDLVRVILPEGLECIEKSAFEYCGDNLMEIVIPASVTEIGEKTLDQSNTTTIVCEKGSAAEAYAVENDFQIRYMQENEIYPELQLTGYALSTFEYYQDDHREFMMSLDQDLDGTISRDEIQEYLQNKASEAEPGLFGEKGKDYLKLTFQEYLSWAFDENQDGVLKWPEYNHYLSIYGITDQEINIPLQ